MRRSVGFSLSSIPSRCVVPLIVWLLGYFTAYTQQLGTPIPFTHSHNDYLRKTPLWEALGQGLTSVEADVYYRQGELRVAHWPWQIKKHRSLEELYLKPLDSLIQQTGSIYPSYPYFTLWIDFKESPKRLLGPLRQLIAHYPRIWPLPSDSGAQPRPLTLVLTGNRPNQAKLDADPILAFAIADTQTRRPPSSGSSVYSKVLYNFSFTKVLGNYRWRRGLTHKQLYLLITIMAAAQETGTRVRVYNTPDDERLWAILQELGVAYISTDTPERLARFLQKHRGI